MPRRTAGRSSSPLLGSHQSAQEVAEIAATQPALFAAASAKKHGKAPSTVVAGKRQKAASAIGKKTFVFKKLLAEASSSPSKGHGKR